MKAKRNGRAPRRGSPIQDLSPQALGLDPALYDSALRYLFDRPMPQGQEQEWFWSLDEPEFEAGPLEWTRIQTALFANAGHDLAAYDDEQVGMGLHYVMSNAVSNVPFAAIDPAVPEGEALRMVAALPRLWEHCLGPRLGDDAHSPIGARSDRLYFVCYMWFDVWPTFWNVRHSPQWQQAMWNAFDRMLSTPWRDVQVSALHGIGHHVAHLGRPAVERRIEAFVRTLDPGDDELRNYAHAAAQGCVQ